MRTIVTLRGHPADLFMEAKAVFSGDFPSEELKFDSACFAGWVIERWLEGWSVAGKPGFNLYGIPEDPPVLHLVDPIPSPEKAKS